MVGKDGGYWLWSSRWGRRSERVLWFWCGMSRIEGGGGREWVEIAVVECL